MKIFTIILSFFVSISVFGQTSIIDSIDYHYDFNTDYADTYGSNDLTNTNATLVALGTNPPDDNCAYFDNGNTDYLTFTTAPSRGADIITIAVWIKHDETVTNNTFWNEATAAGYDQFTIKYNTWTTRDASTGVSGTPETLSFTSPGSAGWHFYVFEYYAGHFKRVYIDGSLDAETTTSVDQLTSDAVARKDLGTTYYDSYYMYGKIDELSIFHDTLSAGEIAALYNSGTTPAYSDWYDYSDDTPPAASYYHTYYNGVEYLTYYDGVQRFLYYGGNEGVPDFGALDVLYVEPLTGNDANPGTSPDEPIKTLGQANTMYSSFDIIALADTVHYGTLSLNGWNGVPSLSKWVTVWNKYGNGRFSIKGTKRITGWTNVSGNVWIVTDSDLRDREAIANFIGSTNMTYETVIWQNALLINDTTYGVAKYPDVGYNDMDAVDAVNSQYFDETDESFSNNEWQGGWVYFGARDWIADKAQITSNSANRIYINPGDLSNYEFTDWYSYAHLKYKILNHVNALSQKGEWVLDNSTQQMYLYWPRDPDNDLVYASIQDSVISIDQCSYVRVSNGFVQGGNNNTIRISQSSNIDVDTMNIDNSPYSGVIILASSDVNLHNDTITRAQNNGVFNLDTYSGTTSGDWGLFNSYFKADTTWYQGDRWIGNYAAFYDIYGRGHWDATENVVRNAGYIGFGPSQFGSAILLHNVVDGYAMHMSDGGGLYSGFSSVADNKIMRENLIMNTGTDQGIKASSNYPFAPAIYLDNGSQYWVVDSNVTINTNYGTFINYSATETTENDTFRYNVSVNPYITNSQAQSRTGSNINTLGDYNINHLTYEHNVFWAGGDNDQIGMVLRNDGSPAYNNTIDYNEYYNPFITDDLFFASYVSPTVTYLTHAQWTSYTGWDVHSTTADDDDIQGWSDVSGITEDQLIWPFANWTDTAHEFSLGAASFRDEDGNAYSGSITLQPWDYKVLIYYSGSLSAVDEPVYYNGGM